jgi:hypothetical protein
MIPGSDRRVVDLADYRPQPQPQQREHEGLICRWCFCARWALAVMLLNIGRGFTWLARLAAPKP